MCDEQYDLARRVTRAVDCRVEVAVRFVWRLPISRNAAGAGPYFRGSEVVRRGWCEVTCWSSGVEAFADGGDMGVAGGNA